MELKSIKVQPQSKEFDEVARLIQSEFPKDEQSSLTRLSDRLKNPAFDCTAYYDGDEFVGFTYNIVSERAVFGLYTAIRRDIQSQGYGSAIQREIQQRVAGREFTFNIEVPKDGYDNTEQRKKRLRFYERLGFAPTGYRTLYGNVEYWVMSNHGTDFDRDAFEELFLNLLGEEYLPKLEKIPDQKQQEGENK